MMQILLTLLVALSVLAGCNDKGAGVSTGTSSSLDEGEASKLDRTKTLTTEQKTAATIAMPVMPLIGAVWGEYVGADVGLGIFIQRAQHAYQVALVFAAILVIAALSVGLFLLTSIIERIVIPWHFRGRGEPNPNEERSTTS